MNKILDRVFGAGAIIGLAAFLSVIVFRVASNPPIVPITAGQPRVNGGFWDQLVAPLRPFFVVFNDYALYIIIVGVVLMAAIDFWISLRPGGDSER